MITREQIVAEIQRVPEKHLQELYTIIKSYEDNGDEPTESGNVMAKLRRIKISASPDLSENAELHDLESEDGR